MIILYSVDIVLEIFIMIVFLVVVGSLWILLVFLDDVYLEGKDSSILL